MTLYLPVVSPNPKSQGLQWHFPRLQLFPRLRRRLHGGPAATIAALRRGALPRARALRAAAMCLGSGNNLEFDEK